MRSLAKIAVLLCAAYKDDHMCVPHSHHPTSPTRSSLSLLWNPRLPSPSTCGQGCGCCLAVCSSQCTGYLARAQEAVLRRGAQLGLCPCLARSWLCSRAERWLTALTPERAFHRLAVSGAGAVSYTNTERTKKAPATCKSEKSCLTVTFRFMSAEQFISCSPLIHRGSSAQHPRS